MSKVIAIIGKICSGKSFYARELAEKSNAVILSCDDLTKVLFDNNLGEKHDEMAVRIHEYLLNLAVSIVNAGTDVILEWGFWSTGDRINVYKFFKSKSIEVEWHYVDIDDESWEKNIAERNERVLAGDCGSDYYLDDGLKKKLLSLWKTPSRQEVDVWHKVKR